MYSQEMAQVAETAKTLMENISEKSSTFTSAMHVEHIRGMFKVCAVVVLLGFFVYSFVLVMFYLCVPDIMDVVLGSIQCCTA